MSLDATFLAKFKEIVDIGKVPTLTEIEGRTYTNLHLEPVEMPEPDCLGVDTLTGLADYVTANPDGLKEVLVLVKSPTEVQVRTSLEGAFLQRKLFLQAAYRSKVFHFGDWLPVENFIIALQSQFVRQNDIEIVLKAVGNVTDGVVKAHSDDGVTQQITVKAGITKVADIAVPNPVVLRPFRTFTEILQPASNFIFRMRSGDQAPTCALFEADGGAWMREATSSIKEWLKANLPEGTIILA